MGLFGFGKKDKDPGFIITEDDKLWVEENFEWLISTFGYPSSKSEQIIISKEYFPNTFSDSDIKSQSVVQDMCDMFVIDSSRIKLVFHTDLRDTYGMPFGYEGDPFEVETELLEDGNYLLHIANTVTNRPKRLIFCLIYEFIRIHLTDNNQQYDVGDDTSPFLFIAGIFFGFGIPLSQGLRDVGRVSDGFWETSWSNISEMPIEVMTYGLAVYSKLVGQDDPKWKYELPQEIVNQFDAAMAFLNERPLEIFDKSELEASDMLQLAQQEFVSGRFETAIPHLRKVLFLTRDSFVKAQAYNIIGYLQIRMGEYEKSIPNFRKSIEHTNNFGIAYDNLGYALIKLGHLEEGKRQLEIALATENNDLAYSYRNFALYYQSIGKMDKAEANFQLAFKSIVDSVDLLELHYANFLYIKGEPDKAMVFLEQAVEKGEREAIKRIKEIKE